jgi:hypothetical protein
MFRSFYLAGFECATGYNMHGEWIDQIAATEHDLHCEADYAGLEQLGIHAVREAIRWPLVDRAGTYDFSSVEPFVDAATRHDFDVIWDLFHYGYPDDIDLFSNEFPSRFEAYCRAAARFIRERMHGNCYFTPINEPSFFAWAAAEVGRFAPHVTGRGFELKCALARAAIRGIRAIRETCPTARIVNIDPICRVVPATALPEAVEHARRFNDDWVFEFWDIVSGRLMPELGGKREYLDIVGLNYYWTNQWELGREGVPLADDDPRRVPLSDLVRAAWRRYRTDVLITETSALGEARAPWIHELSAIAEQLLDEGVPLEGVCLYPILSMPEWHDRDQWARMGLWDLEKDQDILLRKACKPMLEAVKRVQRTNHRQLPSRERLLSLPRSGSAHFEVYARIVWQSRASGATPYRLSIIRSDHPYRLWISSVELRVGDEFLHHVSTAAEFTMLIEILKWAHPASIAQIHGAEHEALETPAVWERWMQDVKEVAMRAAEFQSIPIKPVESGDVPLVQIGSGRH